MTVLPTMRMALVFCFGVTGFVSGRERGREGGGRAMDEL